MQVERYGIWNETMQSVSGDMLRVGGVNLGDFRDLVDAEYKRAGCAFNMRPMFYTGSPFGAQIMELVAQVRPLHGEGER